MAMQDNSAYSTEFIVSYEGDAFSEHLMDIRELGTSLIALSELFDRTNLLLNGEGISVEISLRTTQPGSFEIVLYLAQALATTPFAGGMITFAADLMTIIAGSSGLINLIKRLKGRKPISVSEEDSSGRVTLEIEDLHTPTMSLGYLRLEASGETWRLVKDKKIIDAVASMVRPLNKDGIDRMAFRKEGQELESVSKDEVPYFQVFEDTEVEEFTISSQELVIVAPYLGSRAGKWRLRDGDSVKRYAMKDEQFNEDVVNGVRKFGAGDVLVCDVKVTMDNGKSQYEILKVRNHLPMGRQIKML